MIALRSAVLRLVCLAMAMFLAACDGPGSSGGTPGGPAKLGVVATTGMVGDLARNIAGDRASVRVLMGEGVDPHLYKPSPGDVRLLTDADVVLFNGLHLEGRMGEVLENLGKRSGKVVVAVADAIDHDRLRSPAEFEGQHDPHVWFDVSLWSHAVDGARDALTRADPAGEPHYRAAADAYRAELARLHDETAAAIATIPADRRVLITAHDAFGYFGRAYGLEVMAIQGISTDSEAGLKDINALVDTIVQRKVPAVFFESSVPRKAVDALIEGARARGHQVGIGGELFSDAMGADGTPDGTYIGMVRHNVRVIVEGLRAK